MSSIATHGQIPSQPPLRRAIALVLSISLATSPLAASADGLSDALDEMFNVTISEGGGFESGRVRGFYGGAMTLRPVSRGVNVVQFSAPSIDAGCGGIDLFFGSFSFINGEQFEQLLRSLASAAVGYAIKAAIQAMCNPCAAILSELEAALRELNSLAKNTCAIAHAIFDNDARDRLAEQASKIGSHLSSAVQHAADWAAGENKRQAEPRSETVRENAPEENPLVGNLVWKAAQDSLARGANSLSVFLTNEEVVELMMGLYGTMVILPDALDNGDVDGDGGRDHECPVGATAERCDQPADIRGPVIARWDQFFYPRKHTTEGTPVLKCGSRECARPYTDRWTFAEWGGVEEAVNIAMFGHPDPIGPVDYTNDSLVGSIYHGNSSGLSERARKFDEVTTIPIRSMLLEIQKDKAAVVTLGMQWAAIFPDWFAYQMGAELQSIANNIFSGQDAADPPPFWAGNLEDKSRQLDGYRKDPKEMQEMLTRAAESIKHVQDFTRSRIHNDDG